MFSRRFRRRSRPSVPTDMQSPRCNRSPLQPATTHRGEPTPSRHNGRNKKGTPRTRQSSLTLAAFPPWGSSQDGRRAESGPHSNSPWRIFLPGLPANPLFPIVIPVSTARNGPHHSLFILDATLLASPQGSFSPWTSRTSTRLTCSFLALHRPSGRLAHRNADFRCVPRLEDSTSGLCHTPGTRAGSNTLVGSNPTSSATHPGTGSVPCQDFLLPPRPFRRFPPVPAP